MISYNATISEDTGLDKRELLYVINFSMAIVQFVKW